MSVTEAGMLRFEPIGEAHLDEVMPIEVEAYPESWTVGMFRQEIRSPRSHFFVVFLDDVLVGYGGFWLVLDEAHITSVTVRDLYRQRGFGTRIVRHLLHVAETLEARRATLEVRPSNTAARRLYERMGFREAGRRKNYYPKTGEDALIMMHEFGPHHGTAAMYTDFNPD